MTLDVCCRPDLNKNPGLFGKVGLFSPKARHDVRHGLAERWSENARKGLRIGLLKRFGRLTRGEKGITMKESKRERGDGSVSFCFCCEPSEDPTLRLRCHVYCSS